MRGTARLPLVMLAAALLAGAASPAEAGLLGGYRRAAKGFSRTGKRFDIERIAVLPFKPTDGSRVSEGVNLSEEFTTRIARTGTLQVIERTLLESLLKEHRLSRSGVISRKGLAHIGKVAHVQAVIMGTYSREADRLTVHARLVRLSDGMILDARRFRVKRPAPPFDPEVYEEALAVAGNAERAERARLGRSPGMGPGAPPGLPALFRGFLSR